MIWTDLNSDTTISTTTISEGAPVWMSSSIAKGSKSAMITSWSQQMSQLSLDAFRPWHDAVPTATWTPQLKAQARFTDNGGLM